MNAGSGIALGESVPQGVIANSVGGTFLELAIRAAGGQGGYDNVLSNQDETPILGEDYAIFLEQLDAGWMLNALSNLPPGVWLNSSSDNVANLAYGVTQMQASISLMTDEPTAELTREYLMGTGLPEPARLALTFSQTADQTDSSVRSPTTAENTAYGTGYVLSFRQPSLPSGASRARILNSVESVDLASGAGGSDAWTCNYHFQIVRPQDAANLPLNPYCLNQNSSGDSDWPFINTVLGSGGWTIYLIPAASTPGERVGCIIPTNGPDQCYGSSVTNGVDYNLGTGCNESLMTCPHWLTICKKTQ